MNSWKAKRPPAWDLRLISATINGTPYFYIPSVKNVHEWNGENIWLLGTGKVGNMSVKRDVLGQL